MPQVYDLSSPDGGQTTPKKGRKRTRPKRTGLHPTVHVVLLCLVIAGALGFLIYHYATQPAASARYVLPSGRMRPAAPAAARRSPETRASAVADPLGVQRAAERAAGVAVEPEGVERVRRSESRDSEGIH